MVYGNEDEAMLIVLGAIGFLGVLGIASLVMAWRIRRRVRASQNWLSVQGTITDNNVRTHTVRDSDGTYTVYEVIIAYTYKLNGKQYTGHRVRWSELHFDVERNAERFAARYPHDSHVWVYFDPEKPEDCTLIHKGDDGAHKLASEALGFLVPVLLSACCCTTYLLDSYAHIAGQHQQPIASVRWATRKGVGGWMNAWRRVASVGLALAWA